MARVVIDDMWLKADDEGNPPSAAARRSLANARDPMRANVPERWRAARYGMGKRWRARWFMVDPDGVKRAKSKKFAKLSEAEAYKAAMEDDVRRGRYHDPMQENRRFCDVAERWLESKLNLRDSTYDRYERELRTIVNPRWGDVPLRGIVREDVQAWVPGLQIGEYPSALANGRRGGPLAPATIRHVVGVTMSSVLKYAVEEGWLQSNPVERVVLPAVEESDDDMVYLTIGEVELLADTAAEVGRPEDGLLVRFQAYVGSRINETLSLRIGDVDWRRQRVRIARTWTRSGGSLKLAPPKNGKARWAAVPEFLMEPLRRMSVGHADSEWLFRTPSGTEMRADNWRARVFSPAVGGAGMEGEGVTIHSLRHTYASLAIAAGADVKTLQVQLGHSSATITLDTYAALWPERTSTVARAVNAARDEVVNGGRDGLLELASGNNRVTTTARFDGTNDVQRDMEDMGKANRK